MNVVDEVLWGVNHRVATCRHVLGPDFKPLCRTSRGVFLTIAEALDDNFNPPDLEEILMALPVCAKCKPLARMRGVKV